MQIKADSLEEYIQQLPNERIPYFKKLQQIISQNIPAGFKEIVNSYGINYVVPHDLYPLGYHVNPKDPLPFICIASQKNFIALYHLGLYAHPQLLNWFKESYPLHCKTKLDMGKSCIRLKKMEDIPCDLIAELISKINVEQWIEIYETNVKR